MQKISKGGSVTRCPAAEPGDELTRLAIVDQLFDVLVGERCDAKGRFADQLGEDSPGPERHQRPEQRILDLCGLVTPDGARAIAARNFGWWLAREPEYVVLHEPFWPVSQPRSQKPPTVMSK